MKRIYVQNGIVFFYGNPAGYLGDGKAVIDCMFQKEELVSFVKEQFFVEPVFREGVYDRLSEGGGVKETAEVSIGEGRRLRIYQLGQDSPIMMRFISLAERKKRGYDRPRREEYVRVYEGEIVDCQHFFRQIFLGYFSDIVQAFDTLRKNVCGDDYTSLHNPIVLSSVLPAYGMFHSIQILFL